LKIARAIANNSNISNNSNIVIAIAIVELLLLAIAKIIESQDVTVLP